MIETIGIGIGCTAIPIAMYIVCLIIPSKFLKKLFVLTMMIGLIYLGIKYFGINISI